MVTSDDEPFYVYGDEQYRVIIDCKKADDRDLVVKRFKQTLVLRRIEKDKENPKRCFIQCKNEKKQKQVLAIILTTMTMIRRLPIK